MAYPIVYSDPPWPYYGAQDKWAAAAKFYQTQTVHDLIAIAKPPLATPGILFMWTTSAHMENALRLLKTWKLYYRGIAFVWIKTSKTTGEPLRAQGVRPSITKPLTEFVVVGSTQEKGRPLPLADEGIVQTVFAPKREHSRKPDEVRTRIGKMYPQVDKLEMFARSEHIGWVAAGDQIDKFGV